MHRGDGRFGSNPEKNMPRRYTVKDIDTTTVATLLGCKPNHGLVNTLNDLAERGLIEDGDTYGWLVKQVCEHQLARLSDVTRKPAEEAG